MRRWKRSLAAPLLFFAVRAALAGQTKVYSVPGDLDGAAYDGTRTPSSGDALAVLSRDAAGYVSSGTLTLPLLPTPLFNAAVASWDADTPPGTSVEVFGRLRAYGEWSPWFSFGRWDGSGASVPADNDAEKMDVDTLKLEAADRRSDAFQLMAVLRSSAPARTPVLRLLAAATSDEVLPLPPEPVFSTGPWVRDLDVPERSQMTQQAAFARDICSPTSLAMVLQFWKVKVPTAVVARAVQDRTSKRYGDWPFNTAFAAKRGLRAWVARLNSLKDLEDEIAAGRPVVVSLRFRDDALAGAPIHSTRGHLVVVRGFTRDGDVIVNDPAAPSAATVRRVYPREQFRSAWLENRRGLAYFLAPRFPVELASGQAFADLRAQPGPGDGRAMDRGRLSQLLFGERVLALKTRHGWTEVEALEQRHRAAGAWGLYQGWVPARDLITLSGAFHPNAVVASTAAAARQVLPDGAQRLWALPLGTRLMRLSRPGVSLLGEGGGRAAVRLADGSQVSVATSDFNDLPLPDETARRAAVLRTARLFLGRRYVWGGRDSIQARPGDGVDCSGLVSLAHRAAGVDVPRDAHDQFLAARQLPRAAAPGDLVFLSKPGHPEYVSHVAIYEGGDSLIEAVEDAGVRETTFEKRFGKPLSRLSSGDVVSGRTLYFGTFLGR